MFALRFFLSSQPKPPALGAPSCGTVYPAGNQFLSGCLQRNPVNLYWQTLERIIICTIRRVSVFLSCSIFPFESDGCEGDRRSREVCPATLKDSGWLIHAEEVGWWLEKNARISHLCWTRRRTLWRSQIAKVQETRQFPALNDSIGCDDRCRKMNRGLQCAGGRGPRVTEALSPVGIAGPSRGQAFAYPPIFT